MPRIPVHTTDSAPEASREALKQLEATYGKVLNIHGEMAHSPAVLHSYVALQDVIREHALLDARVREAIALAVGNQDECTYCQSAHTGGGKAAGLSDDEMIAIRRGEADFDPALDVLLTLERGAADRALGARDPEPAHELLQPPRPHRARRPSGAPDLRREPPFEAAGAAPVRDTST